MSSLAHPALQGEPDESHVCLMSSRSLIRNALSAVDFCLRAGTPGHKCVGMKRSASWFQTNLWKTNILIWIFISWRTFGPCWLASDEAAGAESCLCCGFCGCFEVSHSLSLHTCPTGRVQRPWLAPDTHTQAHRLTHTHTD